MVGMVRKPSVERIVLAKRWGITLEKAQKTIQATTQRRIRAMVHPLLSRRSERRIKTFIIIAHPAFSDMMFASTVSRRGNICAQLYATDFGQARVFPMASRSEVHETLSFLFAGDGVPPACICNNSKEMEQGKFHQKLKDAACQLKQLELYTPSKMLQKEK